MEFRKGTNIPLEGGKTAQVIDKIGEGGQGIVYSVKIDGKDYALKWYTFKFQNKKGFRNNLLESNYSAPKIQGIKQEFQQRQVLQLQRRLLHVFLLSPYKNGF